MSAETELLKQLKNIDDSINRMSTCFVEEYAGTTIHQTLEEIKVVNNDISETLKRVADALEKQVANQIMINAKIMGSLNDSH
jgi:enolase